MTVDQAQRFLWANPSTDPRALQARTEPRARAAETVTVDDGHGPQTAYVNSDFSQGAWINVPVNVVAGGTVTVTVTRTAGVNAVVSGIFLG